MTNDNPGRRLSEPHSADTRPTFPEWKRVEQPWPLPPPQRDESRITEHTVVVVEYDNYPHGLFQIYFSDTDPAWPKDGDNAQKRLATLQFAVAEIERALPIMRAMIEEGQ